jgi:hypothetical protein
MDTLIITGTSTQKASDSFRLDLVQAYNRWCVAKDLPNHHFKSTGDIESITWDGLQHFQVQWKDTPKVLERVVRYQDLGTLLRENVAKQQQQQSSLSHSSPLELWIQGHYYGLLQADTNIDDVLASIHPTENRLEWKESTSQIRIERYYRGMLRKNQVWDHIWDNLVALEDPQVPVVDSNVIVGTATLQDWVMGGTLTSRLWIQDEGDRILFLRPLFNDDPATSDRRYELRVKEGNENDAIVLQRMEMVRFELERLRYLATLQHPYEKEASTLSSSETSSHDAKIAQIREKLGHGRTKPKFFGL